MRNPIRAALRTAKHRKRAAASVVSVGAIGALALGTLGTGVATAQNMIGSGGIQNQSINSWDIGRNQVGASELRGPAHDSGPAVRSHHVQDQSLGHWDIKDQTLGHWDIKDGTIGEWDLNEDVTRKLNNSGNFGDKVDENELGMNLKTKVNGMPGYRVKNTTVKVPSGESASATVECPAGSFALGGGVTAPEGTRGYGSEADLTTNVTGPVFSEDGSTDGVPRANAWRTVVTNDNGEHDLAYLAWVSCASTGTLASN